MVALASGGVALLSVVTKASPSARVEAAANALAEKLSAIAGAEFGVTTGDGSTGIAVGVDGDFAWPLTFTPSDPTKTEDYTLRSHAGGLYVGGASDLAVEHAVWDLLYRLGWRQYFPTNAWEIVPSEPELSVTINVSESPDYYSRNFKFFYGSWDDNEDRFAVWESRNRLGQGVVLNAGHAYNAIIDRNQATFDAHPEYFTSLGGARQIDGKFDISNADLRQLVVDDTLALFAGDPSPQSISLEPSDGSGWGDSEPELALGSITDRVVTLCNQAAVAVDALYPGQKYIGVLAYNKHSPPPNITVHARVVVSIATRFITGGFTVEQLLDGWSAKATTLGIREYHAIHTGDRDLPGQSRASHMGYIKSTVSLFFNRGARFLTSEMGDGWGQGGLGYWLAARYLWDTGEAASHDALVADFLARCFGEAEAPMAEFYELTNGANKPLLSPDLIGRMYIKLGEALALTADAAIRRRIYDLVLYTRYVELFRAYLIASPETSARQDAFAAVMQFAYQIHDTHMVHSYGLWRDLPGRDDSVSVPSGAEWHEPEETNPWKVTDAISDAEMDGYITDGIANNPLLAFTPVGFTDNLVPATPLELTTPGPVGDYNYVRGTHFFHTYVASAPGQVALTARGGRSKTTEGDVQFELFPRNEPELLSVDSAAIPPDKTYYDVTLDTEFDGMQSIRVADGTGGYDLFPTAAGSPFSIEVSLNNPANFTGRWTLYFYVPEGTTSVGGYSWGGSGEPTNDLLKDGDGNVVFDFPSAAGYWHVEVPEGQDGRLWSFDEALGKRALMTVPPYVARSAEELLLPREVVEGLYSIPIGHLRVSMAAAESRAIRTPQDARLPRVASEVRLVAAVTEVRTANAMETGRLASAGSDGRLSVPIAEVRQVSP